MRKKTPTTCTIDKQKNDSSMAFNIALAGNGPLLKSVLAILFSKDFCETFPHLEVVAYFAPKPSKIAKKKSTTTPEPDNISCEMLNGIPCFTDPAELFAANPVLKMIVDTSRNDQAGKILRAHCPDCTTIITTATTLFFVRSALSGSIVIGGETRLRRVRDSFSAMIDQVDEDIIIMDERGTILQTNAFFNERNSLAENPIKVTGNRHDDGIVLCCGTTREKARQWRKAVQENKKFTEIYTRLTPDDRVQYFRIYIFTLISEQGEKLMLLMQRNITERISIEQRLQQSEKMAAIGDLSTYIAHEIRNPLFAIGGFANALLRSPTLDENAQEKARIILEESQRLDGILKSILNFARPTDQSVGEVDAGLALQQTSALMSIGDKDRGITTELKITPNLPKARGNIDQIKQCLINLVKNAQEAMPNGGKLTLRAFIENHMVCLSVSDTGTGITPEVQRQLFSPFFSTKSKGAGLGLAMTKKIVEEAGGSVSLKSKVGHGTSITLRLIPSLAVQEELIEIKSESKANGESSLTIQKKKAADI